MIETIPQISGWERVMRAADKVVERLHRAVAALESHGVPYAVVGGHAVAEWVGRIDEGAVRTTKDVDILLRRSDFPAAKVALESGGFVHAQVMDLDVFLDGPNGKPSGGVHILYANERVKERDAYTPPDVSESERGAGFNVLTLPALVCMKLTANRLKDRVHMLDLIGVGQLDDTWPARLPPPIGERLQQLLDDPDG